MAEETDPATPPATEPEATEPEGGESTELTPEQLKAELAKVRREAASKRVENNELKTYKEQIEALAAEAAEAELTETQRQQARADAAEQRAAELELKVLRSEVAAEKGLTPEQAARLQGSTKEELDADADSLIETFGISAGEEEGSTPSHRITPAVRPRSTDPTIPVEEKDPAKLAEAAFARSGRKRF